jgi:hypothetical protein
MLPFDAPFHFASPVSMTLFLGCTKKKGAPTPCYISYESARPFSLITHRQTVIPMTEIAQVDGKNSYTNFSAMEGGGI